MRKIIFIGQSGEQAVYYNNRTKEALVADKSVLLNTEGARRSNRGIIPLMFLFIFLGLIGSMISIPAFSGFRYNSWMVPVFILALLLYCAAIAASWIASKAYNHNFLGIKDIANEMGDNLEKGVKDVGKAFDSGIKSVQKVFGW